HAEHCTPTTEPLAFEIGVFRIGQCVRYVDCSAFKGDSSSQCLPARGNWMLLYILIRFRREAITRRDAIDIAIAEEDSRPFRLAKPRRRLCKSVQDRLDLELRAADDLEHICGSGLLFQRLSQFGQQPRVLDRDHGLGSEARDQRDLLLSEW